MLSYKRHLARRLLTKLLMGCGLFHVCATSGCLLPQEDRILDPVPAKKNRSPRILEEQTAPTRFITINNGANCRLDFSFKAEDPDVEDVLYTDWYIDYFNNPSQVSQDVIQPDGINTVRPTSAVFSVDFATDTPLRPEGYHLVEGLLTDGFLVNRVPQPRPSGDPTY